LLQDFKDEEAIALRGSDKSRVYKPSFVKDHGAASGPGIPSLTDTPASFPGGEKEEGEAPNQHKALYAARRILPQVSPLLNPLHIINFTRHSFIHIAILL